MGVGEMGRLVLATLETAGYHCSTVTVDRTASRQQASFSDRHDASDSEINVVCVNADQFENFAHSVGPDFFRDRYTIGYWAWETERFPSAFDGAFRYVDEVWALSSFTAAAIAQRSPVPVRSAPLPVMPPRNVTLEPPDRPTFLFSFDFLSVMERKNPLGLIAAFRQAFAPDSGPRLIIKTINGALAKDNFRTLQNAVADRSDIEVIDGYLAERELDALLAGAAGYVSLHRAEGFGLTIAEAMARGIPTIATAYSGNRDFSLPLDPFGVSYESVVVGPGNQPYEPDERWAEPNIDEAADMMRRIVEVPSDAAQIGREAQRHVQEHHSLEVRSALYASLIDDAKLRTQRVSGEIDDLLSETLLAASRRRAKDALLPLVQTVRKRLP